MASNQVVEPTVLDPGEQPVCPICGADSYSAAHALCEHVIAIDTNGQLRIQAGWPIASSWWSAQQRPNEQPENEFDFGEFPEVSHILVHSDGWGYEAVFFGKHSA